MGRVDELIAFLLAALDEDERELKKDPPAGLGYANLAARFAREIAAKRAIVRGITAALPLLPHGDPAYQDALLHILRTLAAVYADLAGYRQEWKPLG